MFFYGMLIGMAMVDIRQMGVPMGQRVVLVGMRVRCTLDIVVMRILVMLVMVNDRFVKTVAQWLQ